MSRNLIENLAFRLQCKECEYYIENGGQDTINTLVSISQHIEKTEHTQYELEIYDFDLTFVKETIDIIKLFEDIEDYILLYDMISKLKDLEYENAGVIIKDAIKNHMLCIENIEDNNIYFALTDLGKNIWDTCNRQRVDRKKICY